MYGPTWLGIPAAARTWRVLTRKNRFTSQAQGRQNERAWACRRARPSPPCHARRRRHCPLQTTPAGSLCVSRIPAFCVLQGRLRIAHTRRTEVARMPQGAAGCPAHFSIARLVATPHSACAGPLLWSCAAWARRSRTRAPSVRRAIPKSLSSVAWSASNRCTECRLSHPAYEYPARRARPDGKPCVTPCDVARGSALCTEVVCPRSSRRPLHPAEVVLPSVVTLRSLQTQ
ncbi:hypothetical protein DFH06DRAFT_1219580 [Mycena polygramma]|nr:hypothetical protein DFH06DRAFT_1219580 [Mycena polygramma]